MVATKARARGRTYGPRALGRPVTVTKIRLADDEAFCFCSLMRPDNDNAPSDPAASQWLPIHGRVKPDGGLALAPGAPPGLRPRPLVRRVPNDPRED